MNQFGYTVSMTDPHTLIIEVDKEGEETMGGLTIQHQGGTLKMPSFKMITDPEADPAIYIAGEVAIGRPDFVAANLNLSFTTHKIKDSMEQVSTTDLPADTVIFANNEEVKP